MESATLILATTLMSSLGGSGPQAAVTPVTERGRVEGIVVDSLTRKPIRGAFVAVDWSGDAGGSNLGRFREQGIYVAAETDEEGRFVLDGVAFRENHPLHVTRSGYVRHERKISLRKDDRDVRLTIRLNPGATITATVADGDLPAAGRFRIRLEAADRRLFLPLREDWPAFPYRDETTDARGAFSFGELDAGRFSLEAIRLSPRSATYHGKLSGIEVDARGTREVRLQPAGNGSRVSIRVAGIAKMRKLLLVGRPELLLWVDTRVHHPEDSRLGHLLSGARLNVPLPSDGSYTLENFPAGEYAIVVASLSRGVTLRGSGVRVQDGVATTVELPPSEPVGVAVVRLDLLGRRLRVEARAYAVKELCELLTKTTGSRPQFLPDGAFGDERVLLEAAESTIWELLETVHAKKGWKLEERGKDSLILRKGE